MAGHRLLAGCVLLLVACDAAPAQHGTGAAVSADPALRAHAAALLSGGVLRVATDATTPPAEFIAIDGKTMTGFDIDLAAAIAAVLGVRSEVMQVRGPRIPAAVQHGRADVAMSSLSDTASLEQSLDVITYFRAGTAFIQTARSGTPVRNLSDLCGLRVAVVAATPAVGEVRSQADACEASGRVLVVDLYPDQPTADAAVQHRRDDVCVASFPLAVYAARLSSGRLAVSGVGSGGTTYGIGVAKGSPLVPLVQAALEDLMRSGVYASVLSNWGLQSGALSEPALDPSSP